jgi:hypothetical protein
MNKYKALYIIGYQCQDYLVNVTDLTVDLSARLDNIIKDRPAISPRFINRAQQHRQKTSGMWAQVFDVLVH